MGPVSFSMSAVTQGLQSRGGEMRRALAHHLEALTTGRVPAPQRHLRGDMAPLAAIESRTPRLEAERRGLLQAETRLQAVQNGLDSLRERHAGLSKQLRQATLAWSIPGTDALAGQYGRDALADMTGLLRQAVGGQHLFAGNRTDTPPLPPADTILAAARDTVAGLTTANAVAAALETFFHDPLGGFETQLYAGGAPVSALGQEGTVPSAALPTAADPALRHQLKGLTMAALLGAQSDVTDPGERRALATRAADTLLAGQAPMTALAARTGFGQAEVARGLVRNDAEADALVLAREALVGVDPFDAATRLEEKRVALETLYAVTARVSRLSLTEYLR